MESCVYMCLQTKEAYMYFDKQVYQNIVISTSLAEINVQDSVITSE